MMCLNERDITKAIDLIKTAKMLINEKKTLLASQKLNELNEILLNAKDKSEIICLNLKEK